MRLHLLRVEHLWLWLQQLVRVARTGMSERFEFQVPDQPRWLSGLIYPPRTGEFAAIFEDITERKNRDQELRLAEERFQRLLNSNIVGVAIGDGAGALSFSNDNYLRVLGVTREELVRGDIRWDRFSDPAEIERDLLAIEQVRGSGASAARSA